MTNKQQAAFGLALLLSWFLGGASAYGLLRSGIQNTQADNDFWRRMVVHWESSYKSSVALRHHVENERDVVNLSLQAEEKGHQVLLQTFMDQQDELNALKAARRPTCKEQKKLDCRLEWQMLGDMYYNKCANDLETCQMSKER